MPSIEKSNDPVVAFNRQARHEYKILETFEAGMELKGSEIKSIREGAINLKEGYAHVVNGELFLEGVHISPYLQANLMNHEPVRTRRLLMHRREIDHLQAETQLKRLTLIPLKVFFKNGRAKIEIGLAQGKKFQDKREDIKKRETKRLLDRAQKAKQR